MSSATNEGRIKKNSNKNQSRLHLLLTLISPLNKAIDLKQQVSLAYAYRLCLFLSEPKSQTYDATATEFYHSWNRNIVQNSPESWEALTR